MYIHPFCVKILVRDRLITESAELYRVSLIFTIREHEEGVNMPSKINLVGQRFERLTVISECGRNSSGKVLWKCICDCGNEKITHTGNLRSKQAMSCGCYNRDLNRERLTTHGLRNSPEYTTWQSLKNRCTNETSDDYKNYGCRGIKVCDEWMHDFNQFLSDMGNRPSPTHSIDRINVDGNYEPSNCKWATPLEQAKNKRVRSDSKSGAKGVIWDKESGKWRVFIGVNNKIIRIGRFKELADAIKAREEAELKYW